MLAQTGGIVMADDVAYQLRCDPDWLDRVERAAKKIGLKKAAYIRMVVTQRMDAEGVPDQAPPDKKKKPKNDS